MRNARGCVNGVVSTSISGDLCKRSRCFTLLSCNWHNSFIRVSFDAFHFLGGPARLISLHACRVSDTTRVFVESSAVRLTFGCAVELSQLPDLSLISLIGILQISPWQIYGIYSLTLMHKQISRR
jgi:hypothetical protein